MGANSRHYKALMKKNFINWRRTPCGSLCEILCPLILMFVLIYARSQTAPELFDKSSLYSIRRSFYPIAKPEIGNKFMVSLADQFRQLDDYRDFYSYLDAWNTNQTQSINAKEVVEEFTQNLGVPDNSLEILDGLKDDIETLTDLSAIIANTPIKDFNERIPWDTFDNFLKAFGLD